MISVTGYATILSIGIILCMLLTESIKKAYQNADKKYSSNIIALINAFVIGIGGTAIMYVLMHVPFDATGVTAMISIAFFIWIGSMVGFDKVVQAIGQIQNIVNGGN